MLTIKVDDNSKTVWALGRILSIDDKGHRLELEVPRFGGGFSILRCSPRECALIVKENSPPLQSFDLFNMINYGVQDNSED